MSPIKEEQSLLTPQKGTRPEEVWPASLQPFVDFEEDKENMPVEEAHKWKGVENKNEGQEGQEEQPEVEEAASGG